MSERQTLLSARQLTKRFGGLAAVNNVNVDLWLGHILKSTRKNKTT